MRLASLWIAPLLPAVAAVIGLWSFWARPVDVPPAPSDKLACVSYTPFRGAQSPFDPSLVVPERQIAQDLDALRDVTPCVRIYALDLGLDRVVPLAAARGMRVLLGIWIGRDAAAYEKQIETAIELAKAYPETIRAVIVGNEVLLRGEQSAETLVALIRRVKASTGLPVTYAEVTDFWFRAPRELQDAVDLVTLHILPYWEDRPVAVADALDHLAAVVGEARLRFPGKPILIGETGWPSAGRWRAGAAPSIVNQARFLRNFLIYAKAETLDYNLIEAFDQPWKRALEGTAGGFWGLYGEDRVAKYGWSGPVREYKRPLLLAAVSAVIGLLLLAPALRPGTGRSLPFRLLLAGAAMAGGVLMVRLGLRLPVVARDSWEVAVELGLAAQLALVFLLGLRALARGKARIVAIGEVLACLRRGRLPSGDGFALGLLRLTAAAGMATATLGLCFDPRYRDFPLIAFAGPALIFAALALSPDEESGAIGAEEGTLSLILVLGALYVAWNEGPLNLPALGWAGLTALMALVLFRPWRRRERAAT